MAVNSAKKGAINEGGIEITTKILEMYPDNTEVVYYGLKVLGYLLDDGKF